MTPLLFLLAAGLLALTAPPVRRSVQIVMKTRPLSDAPTLDQLIIAIGKAEGWGVVKTSRGWAMRVYDSRTVQPMGLLGDARRWPVLRTNAALLRDFAVGKLTGRVLPAVAALGVEGFSSTVVSGLIQANGRVDVSRLSEVARKWAPIGAANDPNGLNQNWLGNVRGNLGYKS